MKKYVVALLLSLMMTVLSGCSQSADMSPQAEGEAAQWRTEGFAAPGKLEEEQTLWAGQYLTWEHKSQTSVAETKDLLRLDSGVCGELLWYFGAEPGDDGSLVTGSEGKYVLEIYDTGSGETTVKQFSLAELGLEDGLGALYSMDMPDEEHYVFRRMGCESNEEGMYRQTLDQMIYMDLAGNIQIADFRDIYLEKGIYQEMFSEYPLLQSLNWRCDGKGNICVIDYKEKGGFTLYLFEQSGDTLLEYEGTTEQLLVEPLRTNDGELIFPVYDNAEKCYEFLWADTAERELRSLARIETSYPDICQMYGMQGDDIYYRSQEITTDVIVKWDIRSGRRARLFDFQEAGIASGYEILLTLREGQTPVLHLTKYKEGERKEWLAALTEQKPMEAAAIRVVDLVSDGESKARVAACAVLADIESPNFHYEYEDASAQEKREKILIELTQGKGPDLLFVPLSDMYLLEEKGLLLDIEELIPGELREELLPGALDLGTIGGRLLGVPAAIRANTFAVAADIWTEDTWSLEDVIDLMAVGKLTGAIRQGQTHRYTEPSLTVLNLVNYNFENSFLIDWESGKSHFDDERFIRLLEYTCTDMSAVSTNEDAWLNEGKDILWGYFFTESDFLDFFAHMEAEGGRIAGFPTEGACGSYLMADGGVLVVNANIAQKEAAACFLEFLLGEEMQSKPTMLCMSVRRLVPEDYIVEGEAGKLLFRGNERSEVPVFRNGDTSLHRAKAFLENCVALPRQYPQIVRILAEELSAMYAEGKSPEATAKTINSRVQNYLDEGN